MINVITDIVGQIVSGISFGKMKDNKSKEKKGSYNDEK